MRWTEADLLALLEAGDWHQHHRAALDVVRAFGDDVPKTALVDLLAHADAWVRERCACVLGELKLAESVAALAALVQDDDVHVRYHAVYALGKIGTSDVFHPLVIALDDADADVRYRAAWGLGVLGDRAAVPRLIDRLSDPKLHVRHSVAGALGGIGDDRAIPALQQLSESSISHRERQAVKQALGQIHAARTHPHR